MQHLHLHPEVKQLLQNLCYEPEDYSRDAINSKVKTIRGFESNPVLSSLIGDSFVVEFRGNTNSSGNGHVTFASSVEGAVIANVAPNLGVKQFQDIFFQSSANSTVEKNIREFYELDVHTEDDRQALGNIILNVRAYKKHFRIWAEINVAAARLYNCSEIVLPGMGLGIYGGPLKSESAALARLGEMQFEVLQEIAGKNSDISFRFFGLGIGSDKIGTNRNLTGLSFDSREPMVSDGGGRTLRVVAGSYNIPLGHGSGDNAKIGEDTNVKELLSNQEGQAIVRTELGGVTARTLPKPLQKAIGKYIEALNEIFVNNHNIEDPQEDYKNIKSLIRKLKNRDFNRFNSKEGLEDLIFAERALLKQLEIAKSKTDPSIIQQIIEFIKDIGSWLVRRFSEERKWADTVAGNVKIVKIEMIEL